MQYLPYAVPFRYLVVATMVLSVALEKESAVQSRYDSDPIGKI